MRLFREGLRLQFVCELTELVDVNAWSEPERMWNGLWRSALSRRRLTQAGSDRTIDGFLEGDAELMGALLQESCQIVVQSKGGSHAQHMARQAS
jgi:hypothetical protein